MKINKALTIKSQGSAKRALITGITGQDGSYLAEFLLGKGYEVHGIIRRASTFNTKRLDHIYVDPHFAKNFFLHYGDLSDSSNIERVLDKIKPDEIYNLGAQSHVRVSFDMPVYTGDIDGLGVTRLLEAVRELGIRPKFYQASSSEMYGKVLETPQSEKTPFNPRSPYAIAKVYAYFMGINYREAYNMFICNGILFNHESPRRGETFVTRKITRGLARIKLGIEGKLYLGNLEAKRDWGYAKEYVEAMWAMLQQKNPDDYVIATGETHSVREFVEEVAKNLDMDLVWSGRGAGERGIDKKTGKVIIEIDSRYFRPTEVDLLVGDATKAKKTFGWQPGVNFRELVGIMTEFDFENEAKVLEHKDLLRIVMELRNHQGILSMGNGITKLPPTHQKPRQKLSAIVR